MNAISSQRPPWSQMSGLWNVLFGNFSIVSQFYPVVPSRGHPKGSLWPHGSLSWAHIHLSLLTIPSAGVLHYFPCLAHSCVSMLWIYKDQLLPGLAKLCISCTSRCSVMLLHVSCFLFLPGLTVLTASPKRSKCRENTVAPSCLPPHEGRFWLPLRSTSQAWLSHACVPLHVGLKPSAGGTANHLWMLSKWAGEEASTWAWSSHPRVAPQ